MKETVLQLKQKVRAGRAGDQRVRQGRGGASRSKKSVRRGLAGYSLRLAPTSFGLERFAQPPSGLIIVQQNSEGRGLLAVAVRSLCRVRLLSTLQTAARQASLSFTNSRSLLRLIESVMPPNHLILSRPLLLLPSIFPSIRVFSNESALCIMWPKFWSFSFSISPSNEYSELISFRMDWFDLLAVQETLKRLLQQHSSKAVTSRIDCWVRGPGESENEL